VELLTQVAAAAWEVAAGTPVAGLIKIAPAAAAVAAPPASAAPAKGAPPVSKWDGMPAEEHQMHLRAQRFARVQVAEMRLYETDAVYLGREHRNLYEALRNLIDPARAAFQNQFFATCPSMVDYLHLELVHTLANDDPELLGKDYPGPTV
jgi:hypothetical protein